MSETPEDYQGKHEGEPKPENSAMLSDKAYNMLRFLALIVLPALGAAYFGLSEIWGLPKAQEVVGTIVVIDTFAGILLRSARKSYEASDARFDGAIVVEPGEDEMSSNLNVSLDPEAIARKKEIVVKVDRA